MAKFCVKCGTPLGSGPFCVKCGADARAVATTAPAQPPAAAVPPAQPIQQIVPPAPEPVAFQPVVPPLVISEPVPFQPVASAPAFQPVITQPVVSQSAGARSTFCVKCGSPLGTGPFCVTCGADARSVAASAPSQAAASVPVASVPVASATPQPVLVQPVVSQTVVAQPPAAQQGMSTLAKLGIAAVAVVLVVGAAGAVGAYYVVHKVTDKYHEAKSEILNAASGSTSDSSTSADSSNGSGSAGSGSDSSDSSTATMGNVCRFLSKEDVSRAIGVEIIRADSSNDGCSYVAKGSIGDMTAKHMKAMVASRGADAKSQEMAEKFAGGMFKAFASDKSSGVQDTTEVPVFGFSIDQNNADAQMRLNAKVLGNLGDQQGLPGIGDQAFVSADGMIMVRKGKSLVRIMFTACPCGTEQVKPLAKEIADAL
jgi:hypothetical protein